MSEIPSPAPPRVETPGYDEPNALDLLFRHPLTGPTALIVAFALVFQLAFSAGAPLSAALDQVFSFLTAWVRDQMMPGPLRSLLVDGLLRGLGGLLLALPQLIIVFACVCLFERMGYFGGLSWAFAGPPIHNEYSDAPAAATSSDASAGEIAGEMCDRLLAGRTRLAVGILSVCTILPATRLLHGVLSQAGLIMAGLFLAGVLGCAVLRGLLHTLFRAPQQPPAANRFLLLPVSEVMKEDGWRFLTQTGSLIVSITVLFWAASYYPHSDDHVDTSLLDQREALAANLTSRDLGQVATIASKTAERLAILDQMIQRQRVTHSYAGQLGHSLQPYAETLGWDWRATAAAVGGLFVPQTAVSNLHTVGSLGQRFPSIQQTPLRATWPDSQQAVFTLPVALSWLVFLTVWAPTPSTAGWLVGRGKLLWSLGVLFVMSTAAVCAAWIVHTVAVQSLA